MAHSGDALIIFVKTFSDSSYSKECNNSTATLKSFFTCLLQLISKSTVPNSLSAGPHEISSPPFKSNWLISSLEGFELLPPHPTIMVMGNKVNNHSEGKNASRNFLFLYSEVPHTALFFAI